MQLIFLKFFLSRTFSGQWFSKNLLIVYVCLQRQLETLGAQRAGLEDMLKEMKRKVIWVLVIQVFCFVMSNILC